MLTIYKLLVNCFFVLTTGKKEKVCPYCRSMKKIIPKLQQSQNLKQMKTASRLIDDLIGKAGFFYVDRLPVILFICRYNYHCSWKS
jgi:hypothetical protein